MSAIAGLVRADGAPAAPAELDTMMDALSHRAHDDRSTRSDGPASFGHQRLVTTRESARETLPLGSGGLLFTGDVRLDDRAGLARALDVDAATPDGALVLHAYERWGPSCPEQLLGDFAFAIWDPRDRTVFCARDPLGMKPLFYLASGPTFAFGSEIRALLALRDTPRRLNPSMARDHLLALPGDGSQTLYQGILRLPPAYALTWRPGEAPATREYWRLDPRRDPSPGTDDDHLDRFRSVFEEAVRCRLRATAPIGATLSGGLDSSAVVCVARALLPEDRPLQAFSLRFPRVPVCDEGPYIESVRESGRLVSHDVPGDAGSPLGDLEPVLAHLDEPSLVQNLHLWCALYRAAEAHGVRVMLDGHDGDTAISPGAVRPAAWRGLLRSLAGALRRARAALGRRRPELALGVLDPEFARRTGAAERAASFRRVTRAAESAGGRLLHLRRLASGYPAYASDAAQQIGAVFGIEPRHPFYDRRLLELCLSLPPSLQARDGYTRYVVRAALAYTLPARVRWRTDKADLGPQFHGGFAVRDRALVDRALHDARDQLAGFIDLARLAGVRDAYRERPGRESSVVLWSAVTFALWLRRCAVS